MSLASQLSFLESTTSTIQQINNNIVIAATAGASSTTTGALQIVNGGLAVGGSGFFGGIVTATSFVGSFSGAISGTATTATNVAGGTAGQIHYQSAPGLTAFINTATTGYFLQANYVGAPTWTTTASIYINRATLADTATTATNAGTAYATIGTLSTGTGFYGGSFNGSANQTWSLNTATLMNLSLNVAGGAAGSLIYQSGANATTSLAIGTNGYVLTSNGSAPTWSAISGLSAGNATTATNLAGGTAGQVPYQTAAGATSFYGPGTAGQLLVSAGTSAPVYTNTASIYVNSAVNAQNIFGGTAGQLVYQSSAGVTAFAGPGTAGQLLVSAGTGAPTYTNTSSIYVQDANVSTNIRSGAAGSIPYQSAANTTAMLSIGTNGYVLTSNGSVPSWAAASGITAGYAAQVQTTAQPAAGTYYPVFVNANNASATAMTEYTTSSFTINPGTGLVSITNTTAAVTTAGSHLTIAQPGATGQSTIGFTFAGIPKATIRADGSNLIFDTGAGAGAFYFNTDYGVTTAQPFYVGAGVAWYGYTNGIQAPSFGVGTAPSGTAGEIRATNEITAYYSDRRLKENVQVIDNAIEKVRSLNGITYTPNDLAASFGYDKNVKLVGLFADEVEAVLPEATRPAPFDQDENGNSKSGENYKTIQYEKVVPLLVEAIKEQQSTINILLSELADIKKQLGK